MNALAMLGPQRLPHSWPAACEHLFIRQQRARAELESVEPRYCIVWEDPEEPEAPAKVTVPSPRWLAMALAGGYLPPIGAYLLDREEPDSTPKRHPYAAPIGPMSEEQAMEYLALQVSPRHVSEYRGNRTVMRFVARTDLPGSRQFRNAWTLKQEIET